MNLFRAALPQNPPPHIAKQGHSLILRERVLQIALLAAALFGLVALIMALPENIRQRNWGEAGLYLGLWLMVLFLVLARRLPYTQRAVGLLTLFFITGFSDLTIYGHTGDGRLLLLVMIIFAAVFINVRAALIALALSVVSILGIGMTMSAGWIAAPRPESQLQSIDPIDWLTSAGYFTVFSLIGVVGLSVLLNSLTQSTRKQAELTNDLQEERGNLETRIQQRTYDLEHRLLQIRTASDISRSAINILDPQALLQQTLDLMVERFSLYYVGAFLVDSTGEYAILRAGTGEAGRKMIALGHRLATGGSSMIGWCIANRKARIALDVGADAVRFVNPDLPLTRSELALPLISRGVVLGALTVQSSAPNAFDQDDLLVMQGIADSLSIALDNAQLYQDTQEALEEIRSLNQQFLKEEWLETGMLNQQTYTFENPLEAAQPGSAHTIQIPLYLRDQVIGQLTIERESDQLAPEEKAFIEAVTTQTALALENARLLTETQERVLHEEKVNQISTRLSTGLNIEDILRTAVQELGQLPNVSEVSVHLSPQEKILPTQPSGNGHQPKDAA